MAKLVLASSHPEDVVPGSLFGLWHHIGGSPKNWVAAISGLKLIQTIVAWQKKRLALAKEHPHIQGYDGSYFWERNSHPYQGRSPFGLVDDGAAVVVGHVTTALPYVQRHWLPSTAPPDGDRC